MRRFALLLLLVAMLLCRDNLHAQQRVGADTVLQLVPGSGQNVGQGVVFFPRNVLGMPDTSARGDKPAVDPRSVCSIGLGGRIIIGFTRHAVVDTPGDDLVIYENAFRYAGTRIYAEPAEISVSKDGLTWTAFPCDGRTLRGCAGVTPTDPALPNGGGDAFDLASIGVDSVRWIRIVDVTQRILDDPTHPLYDPTLSGFDLDAVVALHAARVVDALQCTFDPADERFDVGVPVSTSATMHVYDVRGTLLQERRLDAGITTVDASTLPVGFLLVQISTPTSTYVTRVLR
ncbi:MAG: T9SS type A sorting domain-containing protein [Candidatus Kapabacteria bacterium]|nr:T9SS type A sorting domain-containing protein [Candidatus Kapabacteria bacterium]